MRFFFPRKKLLLPRPIPICLSPALSDGAFALCVRCVPVSSQPCFGLVVLYERPASHVSLVSAFEHLPARRQYHHAQPVVLHHIVYIHSLSLVIYPLHLFVPSLSSFVQSLTDMLATAGCVNIYASIHLGMSAIRNSCLCFVIPPFPKQQ